MKAGAQAGGRLDRQLPAIEVGDLTRNRQAQAAFACARLVRRIDTPAAVVAVEHQGQVFGGNTHAIVGDLDAAPGMRDRAVRGGGMLGGVAYQIAQVWSAGMAVGDDIHLGIDAGC